MIFSRNSLLLLLLGAVSILSATAVPGQELFVYPARGQSPKQQSRDRYECHTWAVRQTGFDPTVPQTAQTPPPPQQAPRGGVVRGAAGGATLGAVGGAIAGNAGKGAAVGAATGALFGGMRRAGRRARQRQAQANWAAERQAAAARERAAYNRALSACLTGRGYTVQ